MKILGSLALVLATVVLASRLPFGLAAESQQGGSADPKASEESTADTAAEPMLGKLSVAAAAEYLDRGAHLAEKDCFACHATFSYLPGRSAIDPLAKEVLKTRGTLERFVSGFVEEPAMETMGSSSKRAQRILAAVELARHDAQSTRSHVGRPARGWRRGVAAGRRAAVRSR